MTTPFGHWAARIDEAADEHARRALLGEIGLWRAQRLTDLDAQRDASWALSELYFRLGDLDRAAHEAEQLLALCRTAPVPPREVSRFAEQHARRLARAKSPKAPKPARPAAQAPRPPQDVWEPARRAVLEGRYEDALAQVQGRRGGRAALFRVWARLARALALPELDREGALRALERELAARFEPGASDEEPAGTLAPAPAAPATPEPAPSGPPITDSPLAALVGEPVPADREGLLALLERWIAAHPDRVDEAAAAALRHHVAVHGDRAVAPWLVGITGLALASSAGEATRAALAELDGAWAVTAYGEPPFRQLVEVLRAALGRGHAFVALRRGILRRGPPQEGRIWTLRLSRDGVERLVAVAPSQDDAMPEPLAARLAGRIAHLCDRALLVAPGAGLAALREAAQRVGVGVTEATEPEAVLDALEAVAPRRPTAPTATSAEGAATEAPKPARPPREPDPLAALASVFTGEQPADEDAYVPLVERLSRAWRAFVPLRRSLEELAAHEVDRRLPALLAAVHRVAPAGVRLAEGVGLAVRVAAAVPGGEVEALLRRDDETSRRFGGPGILGLVELARVLVQDGWTIRRALVGITRRERRAHAALDPIADAVHGLVRLVVERDDRHGEIWWLDAPTPETRAAIPLLLLEPHDRLIAWSAASSEALAGWVPPGTPVVAWSGAEAEEVRRVVEAWPPRARRPDDQDEEAAG